MKIHFPTLLLSCIVFITSCKKTETSQNSPNTRSVRYEITGNFTGNTFASYTNASGATINEQITSLPWNKDITYASSVTAAILAVSGNGGVSGQQLTIVVKKAGNTASTTRATANSAGSFTITTPVVTF